MVATKAPPQLTHRLVSVAYASPLVIDCSLGDTFAVTLAGSPLVSFVNLTPGTTVYLLIGSGAGGFTPTYDSGSSDFGANGTPVLSAAANKVDHLGGKVVGTKVQFVAPSLGYSA